MHWTKRLRSTSICVRATAFDSASCNCRTNLVEEAVFDRLQISHAIGPFDMDRQHADIVPAEEALARFGPGKG